MEESIIEKAANSIATFKPELAAKLAEMYLPLIETYHRAQYRGMENIPAEEPFVSVGNHGGVHFMPEALLWVAKYQSLRRTVPMLTLSNSTINYLLQKIGLPLNQLGLVDDSPETALLALESGFAVACYPGADQDLSKPFSERNKIEFFGNVSYARAAIASQKPIVPIVGCGGGETVYTLNAGEAIAKRFKLYELFGIRSWPTFWSFPRGLHTGYTPHFSVPMPSKILLSVLPAVLTDGFSPEDADNPEVVNMLDVKIRGLMQEELDTLAEGRTPIIG